MRDSQAKGEELFWQLAHDLLSETGVTRGTMMGYPCLRSDGAFFACVERGTGHLVAKLPSPRVRKLVASGRAISYAPNGRIFKEWAAVLDEARRFVSGEALEQG